MHAGPEEAKGCISGEATRIQVHQPPAETDLTVQSFCRLSTSASHSVRPAGGVALSGRSLRGDATAGGAAAAAAEGAAGCCGTWPRSWRLPGALAAAAGALKQRSARASSAPAVADTRAPFIWEWESELAWRRKAGTKDTQQEG